MILNGFGGGSVVESKTLDTKIDQSKSFIADIDEKWITFGNIKCYDAEGNIFESYKKVQLARNVIRDVYSDIEYFTTSDALMYTEPQSAFVPSFALTAQCVVLLYENRLDPECRATLDEYFRLSSNTVGLHIQNTLVDWKHGRVIHYPMKDDFANGMHYSKMHGSYYSCASGLDVDINRDTSRVALDFVPTQSDHISLIAGLRDEQFREYMCNLIGLTHPSLLCDVGNMGSPHCTYVPFFETVRQYTASTMFGRFGQTDFALLCAAGLNESAALRVARVPQ